MAALAGMLRPCEHTHSMAAETAAPSDDARWAWLWARPDSALAAAGVEGETLVARVRLGAMALLLISPTLKLFLEPHEIVVHPHIGVRLRRAHEHAYELEL